MIQIALLAQVAAALEPDLASLASGRGEVGRLVGRRYALGGAAALALTLLIPVAHRAGAAGTGGTGEEHVGRGAVSATISRDSFGVPSIQSGTLAGMWFGSGWAQAQDRMVQLELTRRTVEGTLSAI